MKFTTIRETAAMPECPVTEGYLRCMVKRGECPGFYTGNTFRINAPALFAMLEQRSMETIRGAATSTLAAERTGV